MTATAQVITGYCSIYVDDIRLGELASLNPPLYMRKMWGYLQPAISLFNIPAEEQARLVGTNDNPKLTAPTFADAQYEVETTQTAPFVIALGDEFTDFELFSVQLKQTDASGDVYYTAVTDAEYDADNGDITINASKDNPSEAGAIYDIDFYTDGYFDADLTAQEMNILGMCFQVVWQDRFNTDWLSNVSKIEDKSFFEQNRANKITADTKRLDELREKLSTQMRRYEENLYYDKIVPSTNRLF